MRRIATAPLCLLLLAAGLPGLGAAHGAMPGAPCGMACCKLAGAGMGPGGHPGHSGMAMPASPARGPAPEMVRCGWRCAPDRQPAVHPETLFSALPAPVRLPAPTAAATAWRQAGQSATLPYLELPDRPPRA